MTRTHRLILLMSVLRKLPAPVKASQLHKEMGVSLRTIYRDIDALREFGAAIDGEAGFGYTLIEDADLPAMTFSDSELDALIGAVSSAEETTATKSALRKLRARRRERAALE